MWELPHQGEHRQHPRSGEHAGHHARCGRDRRESDGDPHASVGEGGPGRFRERDHPLAQTLRRPRTLPLPASRPDHLTSTGASLHSLVLCRSPRHRPPSVVRSRPRACGATRRPAAHLFSWLCAPSASPSSAVLTPTPPPPCFRGLLDPCAKQEQRRSGQPPGARLLPRRFRTRDV
jgi:hypothetical protein